MVLVVVVVVLVVVVVVVEAVEVTVGVMVVGDRSHRSNCCFIFSQLSGVVVLVVVVSWLVGCLTSQQQASVSQVRICTDNLTCCHTEIEVADQTIYLTQSQFPDTKPTSPSADPILPGAWHGSHWSANV